MSLRKTGLLIVAAFIAASPFQAQAGDLVIINNTRFDSTSITNNGFCSATILGEAGITRAGKTNVVADAKIRKACLFNKHQCRAAVYMTANCSGPKVADVMFDVDTGIQSVTMTDADSNPFIISGTGFTTILDEKK